MTFILRNISQNHYVFAKFQFKYIFVNKRAVTAATKWKIIYLMEYIQPLRVVQLMQLRCTTRKAEYFLSVIHYACHVVVTRLI